MGRKLSGRAVGLYTHGCRFDSGPPRHWRRFVSRRRDTPYRAISPALPLSSFRGGWPPAVRGPVMDAWRNGSVPTCHGDPSPTLGASTIGRCRQPPGSCSSCVRQSGETLDSPDRRALWSAGYGEREAKAPPGGFNSRPLLIRRTGAGRKNPNRLGLRMCQSNARPHAPTSTGESRSKGKGGKNHADT